MNYATLDEILDKINIVYGCMKIFMKHEQVVY